VQRTVPNRSAINQRKQCTVFVTFCNYIAFACDRPKFAKKFFEWCEFRDR
jgi:hypothetical protein